MKKDKNKQSNIIDINSLGPSLVGLIASEAYKKKLEYIQELCDEVQNELCNGVQLEMPQVSKILYQIRQVCLNKTCSTCKWHQKENVSDGMVCVNGDAEFCTCWTDDNYTCPEYEADPEWEKLYGEVK